MGAHALRQKDLRRNKGGGFLYVMTNPAWPYYSKVGRTTNLLSRYRSYQTASPYRDFLLYYYRYFQNIWAVERHFFQTFKQCERRGEWLALHPDDACLLIDRVKEEHLA